MILARFWERWATWEEKWGWFARWQGHRTTLKRKTEQKPNKSKEKERAKIQAVTNLPPLKKSRPRDLVAQGTSMTWGHHLQLGYPLSFIYCSPKNFRWSTYLALGWLVSPFPKSWWVFAHIPLPFADVNFLISAVISNGSEHKFAFGHENLFTSVTG